MKRRKARSGKTKSSEFSKKMQNKRRKSEEKDIPVVMIESSSEEEEAEKDDNYVGDSDEDSCDHSMEKMKKRKRKVGSDKTIGGNGKMESKMCHQCQRSDKDRVVCCSKCKAKRYCVSCMTRW